MHRKDVLDSLGQNESQLEKVYVHLEKNYDTKKDMCYNHTYLYSNISCHVSSSIGLTCLVYVVTPAIARRDLDNTIQYNDLI